MGRDGGVVDAKEQRLGDDRSDDPRFARHNPQRFQRGGEARQVDRDLQPLTLHVHFEIDRPITDGDDTEIVGSRGDTFEAEQAVAVGVGSSRGAVGVEHHQGAGDRHPGVVADRARDGAWHGLRVERRPGHRTA